MKEVWKELVEFDGYYAISNLGRVKICKPDTLGRFTHVGKIKDIEVNNRGYLNVKLTNSKHYYIHILVAKYFIGPCPQGKEVNHKDSDKTNCRSDNLEYKTRSGNMRHAVRHGVVIGKPHFGCDNGNSKLSAEDVVTIRMRYKPGNVYKLSAKYGVTPRVIYLIIKGESYKDVGGPTYTSGMVCDGV